VVVVSYSGKEINAKLVYYGMGLSGKTTNLEAIYETVPETSRGKMVSMKTQSDRTLFFDLLPLDLGEVLGFKTRFLLYTVPGQVFYNATRKLVLKGADAIVFVADSERGKMDENKESLSNLRANLSEYKVNLDDLPWVIQYNKRDLPDVYTVEELERELNPGGVPHVEAVATQGSGVMETFHLVSQMLLERVTRDLKRQSGGARAASATPSPSVVMPAPVPAPAAVNAAPAAQPVAAGPAASASAPAGTSPASRISRFVAQAPEAPARRPEQREAPPRRADWSTNQDAPGYGREINLPPERTRAGAAPVPAPAPAPSPTTAPEGIVVPVRLGRGERLREIILRIVVDTDEAA
jgi:signal recognition particle receptor subunit beta